jgi:4-amino-4-deoxy-L-arabinose transferase-like glycosyltransferase
MNSLKSVLAFERSGFSRPAFFWSARRPQPRTWARRLWRGGESDAAWVRPALLGLLVGAAILYLANLTISGYANTYYSAAALAGSQSWSAWFFGSFDASNFITVDKPPLSTMVMGLSVRLFGLSSWSILVPQAIAGVATVGLLFGAVKRSFGPAAALIAGAILATTPAAVMIFRFNNPDALLTLLFVLAATALLRSLERGSYRLVMLAGACIGAAFLTKYLQAYLVLPAFALVFGLCANTSLRRRIIGLGLAMVSVLVASAWWVAIVELLPAASKPFIGGSTSGSVLDLILGYDGLGRIFGTAGPAGGGLPSGAIGSGGVVGAAFGGGFSGSVGLGRLFDAQFFGEIAWFIPLALVCLGLGLASRARAGRTDRALAGYLLWGGWLLVSALVFSYMSGIIHSYYAVALAPAIAALVGAGLVGLWSFHLRQRRLGLDLWLGGAAVGLACLATAAFGAVLLGRTADFAQGWGFAAVVVAAAVLVALLLLSLAGRSHTARFAWAVPRLALAVAGIGVIATLLAPMAYNLTTIGTAIGGGDPHPGPGVSDNLGGVGPSGAANAGLNPPNGAALLPDGVPPARPAGDFGLPTGADGDSTRGGGALGLPGDGGGVGGNVSDSALLDFLVANRGSAIWIVAANSAQEAGSIELATGLPVMAMGGFTGSDPAPTLEQLKAYIAAGQLRFVLAGNSFGAGGRDVSSVRTTWVTSACKTVDYGGSGSLYDCLGAT